ncbi:hypothetical protein NLG97_g7190 [Lecanicillium saksenae]|uniref:Uncharacterized protein n=1 Tax=Lecanicillium saksenae TaxID=468837 RepID=A0ACC1QQH7_9HYPO|nr:hypothetical protein NLG97_g7190 [Lecanicillium saksenae]
MAIKHNQKIVKNHFHKDWQRRVRTHFDQAGKKASRRTARQAKAAALAPRPVDKLRPIVRCPTIKYNRKVRTGRGFTLTELKLQEIYQHLQYPMLAMLAMLAIQLAWLSIKQLTTSILSHPVGAPPSLLPLGRDRAQKKLYIGKRLFMPNLAKLVSSTTTYPSTGNNRPPGGEGCPKTFQPPTPDS